MDAFEQIVKVVKKADAKPSDAAPSESAAASSEAIFLYFLQYEELNVADIDVLLATDFFFFFFVPLHEKYMLWFLGAIREACRASEAGSSAETKKNLFPLGKFESERCTDYLCI